MRATQLHSIQKDFSRIVLPHQSLIKTMPYRLAYSLVFGGIFLSDILYSQMTIACVMLKEINQQPKTKNQYIMGQIFTWTLFFIMHRSENSSLLSRFLSPSSFCFTPSLFPFTLKHQFTYCYCFSWIPKAFILTKLNLRFLNS